MTRTPEVSRFVAGDPIHLSAEVSSAADLLAALGLAPTGAAGVLPIAPGVALIHALSSAEPGASARWVKLPGTTVLAAGHDPVSDVLVLVFPVTEAATALHLLPQGL